MVAIVAGNGLGLERGSGFVLGSRGSLGQALVGLLGSGVTVNAATGNLVLQNQDEILVGKGPDDILSRTYNSLGLANDDNADNWRESAQRTVVLTSGTLNAVGSTVTRTGWDGSNVVYSYDTTRSAYVAKEGAGSYDTIGYSSSANVFTWTDGNSRVVETYDRLNNGRLTAVQDTDGNKLSYTYTGSLLTKVATASGDYTLLSWAGNNLTQLASYTSGGTLLAARTSYTYDTSNRLITVTTDLTPGDTTDAKTVSTSYTYDSVSGKVASISETGSPNMVQFAYDGSGRIVQVIETAASGDARTTGFSYDTTNRVTTVTDALGKATLLAYDANNNLIQITYPPAVSGATAQVVSYAYNANGDVTQMTDAGGKVTSYSYDGNGNLLREQDAAGNVIDRTYGSNNQLLTETRYLATAPAAAPALTDGSFENQSVGSTYKYNPTVQDMVFSGSSGMAANGSSWGFASAPEGKQIAFLQSGNGTTGSIAITLNGLTAGSSYAVSFFLAQRPNKGVNPVIVSFNGTVLGTFPPGSSAFTQFMTSFTATGATGTLTFAGTDASVDSASGLDAVRVGSVVSAASSPVTTRYVYDGENHLRFTVSAEGDVTEYQYNAAGQLVSTIGYTANAYDLSALASNASISETALAAWASGLADRSSVERTDTTYDFRGNVATVTSYTAASSAGVGLTTSPYQQTTYVYDQAGRLLSQAVNGIATTAVYAYDGLGRLTSSTDLTGATTSVVIDDINRTVARTLANGEIRTSTYDQLGELTQVSDAGVAGSGVATQTTSYKYDALGRLWVRVDAAGNRDFTFYDDAGRKIGYLDNAHYLTEYRYDSAGRVIATLAHYLTSGTSAVAALYDANGNPKPSAMSTVIPGTHASDLWHWNIYDSADRLIEVIDSAGGVVTYSYDGADRLIGTVHYANVIAAATITGYKTTPPAQGALILPSANATSDQVVRSFYDGDGLLIGTLDGEGALTRIVYDEAGRKIESDRYAAFTTASLRAGGTFAQLLTDVTATANPADQHDYYVYDGQDNLRFTLDSNARPTEYVYDGLGHVLHTIDYGASITPASSYSLAYVQGQISSLATNAANRITRAVYDSAGRKVYDINAEGAVTRYGYDALSNITRQTRFATLYTASSDPTAAAMDTWASANASAASDRIDRSIYDALERVAYKVDAEGYVTEYQYDVMDRVLKEIRYAGQYSITDSDTKASVATKIGTPAGAITTSYSYDVRGLLSAKIDGAGIRTNYAYTALGKVYSATVAPGTSDAALTSYRYNAAGQLATLITADGVTEKATTTYAYDGIGNLTKITDPRGNTTTRTYDNVGNLLSEVVQLDAATNATTQRQYDTFGNVTKLTDPRGNAGYFYYDALNRLTLSIDAEGYATETTYSIGDQPLTTRRYYTRTTGASVTARPTLTVNSAKDELTQFAYDKLDRLTRTTDAEGFSETYVLDAFGNRVQVTNKLNGTTTNTFDRRGLLLSETLPVGSTNNSGTVVAANIVNTFSYDARGNPRSCARSKSAGGYQSR